jgi:hypothetical protein
MSRPLEQWSPHALTVADRPRSLAVAPDIDELLPRFTDVDRNVAAAAIDCPTGDVAWV